MKAVWYILMLSTSNNNLWFKSDIITTGRCTKKIESIILILKMWNYLLSSTEGRFWCDECKLITCNWLVLTWRHQRSKHSKMSSNMKRPFVKYFHPFRRNFVWGFLLSLLMYLVRCLLCLFRHFCFTIFINISPVGYLRHLALLTA